MFFNCFIFNFFIERKRFFCIFFGLLQSFIPNIDFLVFDIIYYNKKNIYFGLKIDRCFFYQEPKPPLPKTEFAAIGSDDIPSDIPGVAAPINGVVSCLYIES